MVNGGVVQSGGDLGEVHLSLTDQALALLQLDAADILARILYSAELPISILTTVIGVPILVYFLCTRGKEVS